MKAPWNATRRRTDAEAGSDPGVDPITGVGSRRALAHALSALAATPSGATLHLVDLDGFELFSLVHGEAASDRVLRQQAERLAETSAPCFRLEGGLFALLVDAAEEVVDPKGLTAAASGLSACVGSARAASGADVRLLRERALTSLRDAKRHGPGSHVAKTTGSDDHTTVVTPEKAAALQALLRDGEVRISYQPIVSLENGQAIAFEALCRPQDTHGFDGPTDAFAVADRLGLLAELDTLCRRSVFLDGPGYDMPAGTRLHVNIFPSALGHRSLAATELHAQVADAGLTPERVVFELTERGFVDPQVLDAELRRLSSHGYGIALGDVGMADAGLRHLRLGLFDVIKIATEVVTEAAGSDAAAGVLAAICAYAQRTGAFVVAMGIETDELLNLVREFRLPGSTPWRIPAAQGFWLGRPSPQARAPKPADAAADSSSRS